MRGQPGSRLAVRSLRFEARSFRACTRTSRSDRVVHCYRPLRPEASLEKVQEWCGLRCNTDHITPCIGSLDITTVSKDPAASDFFTVEMCPTFLSRINALCRSRASQKHTQASGSSLTHLCSPKSRSLANALFVHHVIYLRLLKRKVSRTSLSCHMFYCWRRIPDTSSEVGPVLHRVHMLLWVRRAAWLHSQKVEGLSRVSHPLNQTMRGWMEFGRRVGCCWWCWLILDCWAQRTSARLSCTTLVCPHTAALTPSVHIGHHLQQQSNACSHSIHRMLVTQALLLFPNPLFSSRSPTLQLTSGSVIRIQVHPASNARSWVNQATAGADCFHICRPCDVALLDLRGWKILRSKAVAQALGRNAMFFIDRTNGETLQSCGVVKGKPQFCHRLLWKRALQDSDRPSKGFELASISTLKN